jgi:glutamyl-tRNA synthetase
MLYRSFGWEMPEFAHLPLILKPDGKGKLSKRDGDKMGFPVFPTEWKTAEGEIYSGYRESGYLPGAFLNLMALLGWNPGTEQELFALDEMVSAFSLERVNKSGARFDPEKAKWFNQQYLKKESDESLAAFLRSSLASHGKDPGLDKAVLAVRLVRERAVFMKDVVKESLCFFEAPSAIDLQALAKKWKPESYGQMETLKNLLLHAPESDAHTLEQYVKDELAKQGLGPGQVFMPLRVFLVGTTSGPSLFDLVVFIGREEVVRRIDKGLEQVKNL